MTQGLCATALILAGASLQSYHNEAQGDEGIKAIKAAATVSAFPIAIFLGVCCISVWKTCQYQEK